MLMDWAHYVWWINKQYLTRVFNSQTFEFKHCGI